MVNKRPSGYREADRSNYVGRAVTLNGKPAKVVKDRAGDGYIAPLDPSKGIVPFSWVTIYNIVDNHGGRFNG